MRIVPPVVVLLTLGCSVTAHALDRENLRFYLPFEGDLNPQVCGPNTELTFVQGTEQDAQLVAGRRGQGLRVTAKLNLQYVTPQSFAAREGAMAFWMKPEGWSGVGHFRHFLNALGDRINVHFYMYYGNPWLYMEAPERFDLVGGSSWQTAFEQEAFPDGQWTFIAGTWKPGQQAYYINGHVISRRTDGLIEPEFTTKGIVDIPPGDQVLDEIMLFDRVLTEHEIQALYHANTPME